MTSTAVLGALLGLLAIMIAVLYRQKTGQRDDNEAGADADRKEQAYREWRGH